MSEAKPAEDSDVLLCRKITTKAGVPGKEAECVTALKAFGQHADFDKTAGEIGKIIGKTTQEVVALASEVLLPTPETKKAST